MSGSLQLLRLDAVPADLVGSLNVECSAEDCLGNTQAMLWYAQLMPRSFLFVLSSKSFCTLPLDIPPSTGSVGHIDLQNEFQIGQSMGVDR